VTEPGRRSVTEPERRSVTDPGRRSVTHAGRRSAVLAGLAGAGLVLLAGTRPWANVSFSTGLPGLTDLDVPGRRALPAGIAVALAAAAGAVVLAVSGRFVRFLVATGLTVGGAALSVAAVRATRDGDHLADLALRNSLGVHSTDPGGVFSVGRVVSVSAWGWVAVAGALLIALAGLIGLVRGRTWPQPTRRYERRVPITAARADTGAVGAWDALSRGEDPTSTDTRPT
jgi:uncharacterized membrane protein (TIGR02234 family)